MPRFFCPALFGTLALAGLPQATTAQILCQPRDIQLAFAKGTRVPDGKPGPKYWQNRARHDSTVWQVVPPAAAKKPEKSLNSVPVDLKVNYAAGRPKTPPRPPDVWRANRQQATPAVPGRQGRADGGLRPRALPGCRPAERPAGGGVAVVYR